LPKILSLKILNFVTSEAVEKNDLGIVGCKLIDGTGKFLPESKRGVQLRVAFTKVVGLYKVPLKSRIVGKYYAQHISEIKQEKSIFW
jgi:hypothetical protein